MSVNGYNCTLTAMGYGKRSIRVDAVDHGMSIVSAESHSRNARALYIERRTSGSFTIGIIFATYGEYQSVMQWMQGYCRSISSPDSKVGVMRVQIPARRFDKYAVPSGQIQVVLDDVARVSWPISIDFEGARDAVTPEHPLASTFVGATVGDSTSRYFYPSGEQLSAADRVEDALYSGIANLFRNGPVG